MAVQAQPCLGQQDAHGWGCSHAGAVNGTPGLERSHCSRLDTTDGQGSAAAQTSALSCCFSAACV